MLAFIVRRVIAAFGILLAGTFIAYVLVALSGDPLQRLREDNSPGREERIASMTERLDLDTPVPLRYVKWLGGASQCVLPFLGKCDLGQSVRGQDVSSLLGNAMTSTLQLITVATITAAIIGVMVGIITALRQYSRLDYTATLASFLFVSLPLFWFAVLLKQYIAIDLNDWLADPAVSLPTAAIVGVVSGLVWASVIGGDRRRVWTSFAGAFVVSAGGLLVLAETGWFRSPGLGPIVVAVVGLAAAVGLTALLAGFRYRNVLYAALATAVAGIVANLALDSVLFNPSWGVLFLLLLLAVGIAVGIGYAIGGMQRRQAITTSVWVTIVMGTTIVADRMLTAWDNYFEFVDGRVIATFGSETPNYDGGTWGNLLDTVTHLALPTVALILVSVATYSRYTRASMLEVMNQDYVRTARSKGLTDRTVVVRHALRNGLIPITTLMAFDLAGLIGGAVITETVFGWQGMGFMFVDALRNVDPNPAMAFFLVTGIVAVLFNMLADIAYAYLDPRIRLG